MLTSLLFLPDFPREAERRGASFMDNMMRPGEFVKLTGDLVDFGAGALGLSPADLAEWLGVILIRWAEQDRAEMRADIAAADSRTTPET